MSNVPGTTFRSPMGLLIIMDSIHRAKGSSRRFLLALRMKVAISESIHSIRRVSMHHIENIRISSCVYIEVEPCRTTDNASAKVHVPR
jgi:hypothetical protein